MYSRRLKHYLQLEILYTTDLKNTRNMTEEEQKIRETAQVKRLIPECALLYLLDEKGREYSSQEFASFLEINIRIGRDICMVVGGAYGFSEELKNMAADTLSLSKMTFSHQMVRLIVLEQLYRAFTILNGEPYHHT